MDAYEVIITPDAEYDLNELDDYITFELLEPDTATAYVAFIKKELATLSYMPRRYKLVDDEPWHSRGVRRMNAKKLCGVLLRSRGLQRSLHSERNIRKTGYSPGAS